MVLSQGFRHDMIQLIILISTYGHTQHMVPSRDHRAIKNIVLSKGLSLENIDEASIQLTNAQFIVNGHLCDIFAFC